MMAAGDVMLKVVCGVCVMVAVVAAWCAVVWADRETEAQRWQREIERVLAREELRRVGQAHRWGKPRLR